MRPPAVNFHIWGACNQSCRFCFATFADVRDHLTADDAIRLIRLLRDAGVEKVNFAGGEPTLCPHLGPVLSEARRVGLVVGIVSNGARLRSLVERFGGCLDWVGLSVDSAREGVQAALGRGRGDHVRRSIDLFDLIRGQRLRSKLNTVVTRLTWQEDMSDFVRQVRPDRWKLFQVLPVAGENDRRVAPLLISQTQFRAFVRRHQPLGSDGPAPIPECNGAMIGSYVMIDPRGRFFDNVDGHYTYSDPILSVGLDVAFSQVRWNAAKFMERGGYYSWSRPIVRAFRPVVG